MRFEKFNLENNLNQNEKFDIDLLIAVQYWINIMNKLEKSAFSHEMNNQIRIDLLK